MVVVVLVQWSVLPFDGPPAQPANAPIFLPVHQAKLAVMQQAQQATPGNGAAAAAAGGRRHHRRHFSDHIFFFMKFVFCDFCLYKTEILYT